MGWSYFPPVIKNLLIINGVVFLLQNLAQTIVIDGMRGSDVLLKYFALMSPDSGYFQIWQFITYQFMHGGFSHLFFNLFSLWMFGAELENMWGSRNFLIFYLVAGVGGAIFHLLFSTIFQGVVPPVIGASGAIFGVMVAFGLLFPDRYILFYFFIPLKTKYFIAFLIIINILAVDDAGSGVAHLAHLGGAVFGFLYLVFDKRLGFDIHQRMSGWKDSFYRGSGGGKYRGKKPSNLFGSGGMFNSEDDGRYSSRGGANRDVEDAHFKDVNKREDEVTQEDIDRILDKISQSGYKNLTEEEKRILFEASRRMNKEDRR
ncbi:MAG: rhomboid family intramembrane serine protease [Ignavibacteriaceae bacterium]|nr:rhomboid family intramembrane serine protease [Ignavibacteriaceae bacterium]